VAYSEFKKNKTSVLERYRAGAGTVSCRCWNGICLRYFLGLNKSLVEVMAFLRGPVDFAF
jgi:hypothetical protein